MREMIIIAELMAFSLIMAVSPTIIEIQNGINISDELFIWQVLITYLGGIIVIGAGAYCIYKKAKVRKSYKYNNYKKEKTEEFEEIYQKLYNENICNLEKMRKKVRWRTIIKYTLMMMNLVIYMYISFKYVCMPIRNLIIEIIISCLLVMWDKMTESYEKEYIEFYKNKIIKTFVKLVNKELDYFSEPSRKGNSNIRKHYKRACFESYKVDDVLVDDYIKGYIENQSLIEISDIHTLCNMDKEGIKQEIIFQGIFATVNCNKSSGAYIKISKNKLKILNKNSKVEMESREFEKNFDVDAVNKIIAMTILTPDTIEYITDFYNKYKLNFEIIFNGDKIYLRFFTGQMFEPKIFGNSMNKKLLYTYYSILEFVIEITRKVNKTMHEKDI